MARTLWTQAEAAEAFRVTTRTIRDWEREGFPSEGDGRKRRYPADTCIAWRISEERRRVLEELGPRLSASDGPTLDEARRRKELAIAEIRETELRELRGILMPRDDVRAGLERIAQVIRGLPRNRDVGRAAAKAMRVRVRDAAVVLQELSALVLQVVRDVAREVEDDAARA